MRRLGSVRAAVSLVVGVAPALPADLPLGPVVAAAAGPAAACDTQATWSDHLRRRLRQPLCTTISRVTVNLENLITYARELALDGCEC